MRFFLNITTVASLVLAGIFLGACSEPTNSAGIEIGNPTIQQDGLALTADFSVDYSEVEVASLRKEVSQDEPVVLDSFALNLTEVRTYASYYSYMPGYNAVNGMLVWPVFEQQDEEHAVLDTLYVPPTLTVSFTDESFVDEPFQEIELLDGGYLKEIGVSFKPYVADDIYGRVMVDGKYVPFVYDLANFLSLQLRYHYSQIEIDSAAHKANLPVVFRVKLFTKGIDFSKAEISEDGVIYIDQKNNAELWAKLNKNFVPSFQPLRYNYVNEFGSDTAYVNDVWKGIAASVGENTLINGNFRSPFTTDWILVRQYGGRADTSIIKEKGDQRIMMVDVVAGGDSSFSVQLLQENVALIAGVQYQCIFTIWSDVEGEITARIGSYDTYKTVGFSEHVKVGKIGSGTESKAFTFTPEVTDPFARFELNLGKKERKFWIKDVKVLRLTK